MKFLWSILLCTAMLFLGNYLENSTWWAVYPSHSSVWFELIHPNNVYTSLGKLVSVFLIMSLFITSFLCGKHRQTWFRNLMITAIICIIVSKSEALIPAIIAWFLAYYAFTIPVIPIISMMNLQIQVPVVILLYLFIIVTYYWGQKNNKMPEF